MNQPKPKRFQPVLWLQTKGLPGFQRRSSHLIHRLTADPSRQHWTALQPSTSWSRWLLWSMVGLAGFGIIWSCFARIDETVQATGKLEPTGVTKEVKAPLGGVIAEILVRDGDLVEKNQTLLLLDTEAAKAKLKALKIVRERVKADLTLSQAQLGERPQLGNLNSNQVGKLVALQAEYASRIDASRQSVRQAERAVDSTLAQLRAAESSLKIRRQILKDIQPLQRDGAMARSQYLKEYQEFLMLEGDVKSKRSELKRIRSALAEARQKLLNTQALTRIDFSSKVEEGQKQLAELENQISETSLTLKYQRIKAPVSGIVFDLKPTAPGFVISGNVPEPVMKIVPNDQLVARIFITNQDIGFIKLGQKVQVRIDAFPYNEFGDVNGSISKVGSDVLPPDQTYNFFRFPVTVGMQRNYLSYRGKSLRLVSGMSITANIILRQRPVIAIFTQQILPFWDSLQKL
jgi:HlyD family secretion protein